MTSPKRASQKMKLSRDLVSQHTGDLLDPTNGERMRKLKINFTTSAKEDIKQQRESRIKDQNNGHFTLTIFRSKTTRDWIWSKRGLKVGDKITAIQGLSCTLHTKVNKTRGNPDLSSKRCKCKKSIEKARH